MSTPTLHQKPLVKQFIPLTSISGDNLDSVGTLSANVTLGKRTVSHSFQVIRNCPKALVLGWDFLSMHKIVINMQNMSFQLGEDSISFVGVYQHCLNPYKYFGVNMTPINFSLVKKNGSLHLSGIRFCYFSTLSIYSLVYL